MKRRRFLTLAAAFTMAPGLARAQASWQGTALGADVSVTLEGPPDLTRRVLADVPRLLENVEQAFSLYRPASELSQLNLLGRARAPKVLMRTLVRHADRAWHLTGGLFDPTVQPLWQALARGTDPEPARRAVGWHRVRHDDRGIELGTGQALTFNGIAQGFASDVMRLMLARHGVQRALVNIGEYAALGGPYTLGLEDPLAGLVGQRTLTGNGAIATSSARALTLGDHSHILGPQGQAPRWSTVSVEAPSATLADALSTAASLMDADALRDLKARSGATRITTVDFNGNLRTV